MNGVEGFDADLAQALAIVDDERPATIEDVIHRALTGYRDTLTSILPAHVDPSSTSAPELMAARLALCHADTALGDVVYDGPEVALVPALVDLRGAASIRRRIDHRCDRFRTAQPPNQGEG